MRHVIDHLTSVRCSICRTATNDERMLADWRASANEISNLIDPPLFPNGEKTVSYVCRVCRGPIAEITRDAVLGRRDFLYAEAARKAGTDHGG